MRECKLLIVLLVITINKLWVDLVIIHDDNRGDLIYDSVGYIVNPHH